VEVRHERQRPAALPGAAVEDDHAGLGDGERAPGDGAVEPVEVVRPEAVVVHRLDALGPPLGREVRGHRHPPRAALGAQLRHDPGDLALGGAVHRRAVVGGALREQRDRLLRGTLRAPPVAARHLRRLGARPERLRDPAEDG
jgi:hypothetical protein